MPALCPIPTLPTSTMPAQCPIPTLPAGTMPAACPPHVWLALLA